MKLYTRTGDDGTTGLYGGQRVAKNSLRVEAYGTVDEVNSHLGLAAAACSFDDMSERLSLLMHRLFELGADLCTPIDSKTKKQVRIDARHVQEMERLIDESSSRVEPLKYFVLPGGSELAARLHVARCVSRRAERAVITLAESEPINAETIHFLNRLSDLLFALAREANARSSISDVPWQPESAPPPTGPEST